MVWDCSAGAEERIARSIVKSPTSNGQEFDDDVELPEALAHLDPNIVKLIMNEVTSR